MPGPLLALEKKHISIHLRHTGPLSSAFKIGSNEHLSHQHAPLIKSWEIKRKQPDQRILEPRHEPSHGTQPVLFCVRHSQRTVLNAVIGINFPTSHCEDLWWILPAASWKCFIDLHLPTQQKVIFLWDEALPLDQSNQTLHFLNSYLLTPKEYPDVEILTQVGSQYE